MFSGGVFQLDLAARYLHLQDRLDKPATWLGSTALWVMKQLTVIFREQQGTWWENALMQLPLGDLDKAILGEKRTEEPKFELQPVRHKLFSLILLFY